MMKYISIILTLITLSAYGQKTYVIPADSTKLTTVNGTGNELIIENDTRDTLGVLYNRGGGRTDFRALRLQQLTDSTFRLLLGNTAQGQTVTIRGTGSGNFVPYTGATGDVDLGANALNAESLRITGVNGDGHLHLRHQASDAAGSGNNTVLFANSSGDLKYKNDNLYYTTYRTSGNTADRVYRFPDSSGTVALLSNVVTYTMTKKADSIVLTGSNGARFAVRDTFVAGGGGVDSTYRYRLYADIYNEWQDSSLIAGNKYVITDYRTAYDQYQLTNCTTSSYVYKTATVEPIVVTATGIGTLYEFASSLLYPKDVIKYDISYTTTPETSGAARGKIFYRQDSTNNAAWYDFRAVRFYNTNDGVEYLTFNDITTMNEFAFTSEFGTLAGFGEYPNAIFLGLTYQNFNNLIIGGALCSTDTNGLTIFNGIFNQNNNNYIERFGVTGNFIQNTSCQLTASYVTGNMEDCQSSILNNSKIGANITKAVSTNISSSTIDGQIDRVINCAVLTSNLDGRFYWCNDVAVFVSDIVGDFTACNNLYWNNTDANCKINAISGNGNTGSGTGFEDCTITGTSAASTFGNITVQCLVENKTITQAAYPELFTTYPKTIFKGSDSKIYFSYYNGATHVITEIL